MHAISFYLFIGLLAKKSSCFNLYIFARIHSFQGGGWSLKASFLRFCPALISRFTAHEGTVKLVSIPHEKTTFTFILPKE